MFLFLRIIVFALVVNTLSNANAEIGVTSNQNYTDEFVQMVNDLTQMANPPSENETISFDVGELHNATLMKNDSNTAKDLSQNATNAETPKIRLVFPKRSFKHKLAQITNRTIQDEKNTPPRVHQVQTARKPVNLLTKPIRRFPFNIREEKEKEPVKLTNLQQLLAEELIKTYNEIENEIQNTTPERTKKIKRVYIRRRKIEKNTTVPLDNERRFVRRETFSKFPTESLKIIGPIPSGFYGLKSAETTYDGIRQSDLELPFDQNKQTLINTGVISPQFLNLVKQKYDQVLALYEKAVGNYNVYNELYSKAKELGTI